MTCFGRTTETAELWRLFKEGRNLLMLAPRRIGKTVQINHLRDTAAEHGFRAIVLEVAGFREEKDSSANVARPFRKNSRPAPKS